MARKQSEAGQDYDESGYTRPGGFSESAQEKEMTKMEKDMERMKERMTERMRMEFEMTKMKERVKMETTQQKANFERMTEKERFLMKLLALSSSSALSELREHLQDDTVYANTQSKVVKEDQCAAQSMNENKLEDVHVAGRKLFQFQHILPQLLNWEEYGLRITVPEGAVSPSETIEVVITALVGGEFLLPEDSELVSVVYTISVSKPLLKPVLLEIQHCVSIETPSHTNYLSFVTSSNDRCPFEFQSVDKGSFPVGERYGSILISEFSPWAIIQTIKGWLKKLRHSSRQTTFDTLDACITTPPSSITLPQCVDASTAMPPSSTSIDKSTSTDEETESCSSQDISLLPASWFYFAQPLYENKSPGKKWLLMFLFGKDLNALMKYMNEKFKSAESDRDFSFRFKRSDGSLEIHIDTENCSQGWSISPHQGNLNKVSKVNQSTIDTYARMNPPRFPQCRFTITVIPGSNTNPELRHPVTFKGIISDNEVFNIVLSMGDHLMQDPVKQGSSSQQSPTDPKEIFRKQYAALFDLMIPDNIAAIAKEVYSKGLITDETLQDCMADTRKPAGRAHSLLNALRVTIDQPDVLTKLIEVLKDNEAFRCIAEKMESEL